MTLTIRKIEEKDIPTMIDLVHEAWFKDIYQKEPFEKAASAVSLNKALHNSSHGWVAEDDGQVLGMILCSIGNHDSEYRMYKTNDVLNLIQLSKHGDLSEINRLINTFKAEREVYDQMSEQVDQDFDASIEYIVVSSQARGQGIGKSLIFHSIKEFIEKECHNFYLYTDSDCNYKFYDYLDFDQIAQTHIELPSKEGKRQRQEFKYAATIAANS